MTIIKKFVLKYIGHSDIKAELFETIIGPLEEFYTYGGVPDYHSNIAIRIESPLSGYSLWNYIKNSCVPPLIEGNIYLFSYTGRLANWSYAVVGFENGELKEFRDITSSFSIRRWVKEETERLQGENSSLENDVNYWKNKANSLQDEVDRKEREGKEIILRNSNELSLTKRSLELAKIANTALQGQVEDKDKQIREKNELIKVGEKVLQTTQSQLTTSQNQARQKENQIAVMENKLDQRRDELKAVEESLSDLKIESGKKDSELKNREKEIKNLKKNLGATQKNAFDEKLHFKQEKLETLATQLGIQLRRIETLRRRFKELIIAQESNNNNNANTAQENITAVKETLQEGGININNIQRICKKCRKIAQLELELEQTRKQQQYEARQEVPPRSWRF